MAGRKEIDPMNTPALLARDMAFRQVMHFLAQIPNPPGLVLKDAPRETLTLEAIRRMAKGG